MHLGQHTGGRAVMLPARLACLLPSLFLPERQQDQDPAHQQHEGEDDEHEAAARVQCGKA